MLMGPWQLVVTCMLLLWIDTAAVLSSEPADSVEFFENRIRPVLIKHCYECHSSAADEIGGSLVLDSSDAMMSGGDSGPAIAPGNAEASMLIAAIRYESSEMPPDGRLPEGVIGDFERWINAGAVDPRQAAARPAAAMSSQVDLQAGRQFWAFRPIQSSPIPEAIEPSSRGPVDQYLGDALFRGGIAANAPAAPEVRLRRLAFDLTGLPPDQELLARWIADPTPRQWHRIVDSMLASPAFAEHWARHWMDVARYADSNGADFNATHHEAWRYRDYLIRAFAADTPVDQMIRQQIAGDLLPSRDDAQRYDNVVASTFLMLGTKMLSERNKAKLALDVVDEQIDTVGRAFLGLTLGCARCHDHKFDPVPTEDYYALAGIFESTVTLKGESQKYVSTWSRVALPASEQQVAAVKKHRADVKSLEAEIKRAQAKLKAMKENRGAVFQGTVVDDVEAEKVGDWVSSTYFKHFVGEGYVHDDNSGKGQASIRFKTRLPETGKYVVRIAHSPGSNRSSAVPITIQTVNGQSKVLADQRTIKIEPMWTLLGTFDFASDRDAVVTVSNHGTSGYVIADAVQFIPVDPTVEDADPVAEQLAAAEVKAAGDRVAVLEDNLAALKKQPPAPLPEAMAPTDRGTDEIADSHVHIRGEVKNLGPVVPRGFLQVCSSGGTSIRRPRGSGRVELADWLTDPDNPLVSRVFVNRVWMHLMGNGLVRTVDNFGAQGERPTHPELLDALATEFVRGGWHLKPLIRSLVTSSAYQRSSHYRSDAASVDPQNRLLWRMPRRRIPAEAIRDTMLASAGQLDRRARREPMSGRGVLVSSNNADSSASFNEVGDPCRSIYLPVVRGYLPPLMTMLDAADPDLLVGRRPTTNVPAQALVLINSPDVNRWSRQTAERVIAAADEFNVRLELAYAICLGRGPTDADRRLAAEFFGIAFEVEHEIAGESLDAWHEWIAALFACTEFRLLE
jgi:hypothetical protein